jgi:ferrochelatase
VGALIAAGAGRLVGLVLAPHYSRMSIGAYIERAAKAAAEHQTTIDTIESWHLLPAYVEFLGAAVGAALAQLPEATEVVFTAHSLPERILDTGDPYPAQLRESADAVAVRLGLSKWSVGWQSAGRTPEPWLGPDVLEIIRSRAAHRAPGLVICPCGFVADHLEVAYDLDIEAAALARELGLPFARTDTMGTAPAVIDALAQLIVER